MPQKLFLMCQNISFPAGKIFLLSPFFAVGKKIVTRKEKSCGKKQLFYH